MLAPESYMRRSWSSPLTAPSGTVSRGEIACRAVPTAKRERKKAGRQARLAALEAQRKRRTRTRQGVALVVVVAAVVGIVFALNQGKSSNASAAGCPAANGSSPRKTSFKSPPPMCIDSSKQYSAVFATDAGSFDVALDAKQAPVTTNDFVFLARYHFYNGLIFHRVIPGFVVQGGDPTCTAAAGSSCTGAGSPGYSVRGEVPKAGSYQIGSIAMAKTSSQPAGTAQSQFFVIVGQQGVQLPPDYSLFGKVTSGMPVVQKIAADGSSSGTPTVKHKIDSVTITQS